MIIEKNLHPDRPRRKGCLPRKSEFGEWFPAAADYIDVIPESEWQGIIDRRKATGRSQRELVPAIFDQDGITSCAAEAATATLLAVRAFSGQDFVMLNPWSLFWFSGGGRDNGSNIDVNLQYLRDVGVLPMSVWPRSKGLRKPPQDLMDEYAVKYRVDEWYDIRNKAELVSAVLRCHPVVYGRRGHAMWIVDMLDGDRFVHANSWGGDWGDQGFGVERISRDVSWNYGVWAAKTAHVS